jgi:protoporphyrin/coproporphyrin ferrochelatase
MKKAVLLMAYGSPDKLEDIEPYYTDIRRGRKPSPELLDELTDRYKTIGGKSPLLRITKEQAASLDANLGSEYRVYIGMRHWKPWIHEAVLEMKLDGVEEAVGIIMAPHFSGMSIAKYMQAVEEAKEKHQANFKIKFIESWHNHPLFIEALSEKIDVARKKFTEEEQQKLAVIFTAHSLPEKILKDNDPYTVQLLETSELVAQKANIPIWRFAFQSAGRTEEKWLGPDLRDLMEELTSEGFKSMLVCSVGFIADHLEVMYDIDVEGKEKAKELGVHLERTESLNDNPKLTKLFGELIREKFAEMEKEQATIAEK